MLFRNLMLMLIYISVTIISYGQESSYPYETPTHYTIKLHSGFVDSIFENVKNELVLYLKKQLNVHLEEGDFCFKNELIDSIYYTRVSESSMHIPLTIQSDSKSDSVILNPETGSYDPYRTYRMYRYTSYRVLEQPSHLSIRGSNCESKCFAIVNFSKLYEHDDFLLGEIFLDWKETNMDTKSFTLLVFELHDWKNNQKLRLGNTDQILTWDW